MIFNINLKKNVFYCFLNFFAIRFGNNISEVDHILATNFRYWSAIACFNAKGIIKSLKIGLKLY